MSNTKKWAPFKRLRDWQGASVIPLRDIRNHGGQVLPKDRVCWVHNTSVGRLWLTNGTVYISRVKVTDVRVVAKKELEL